MEGEEHHDRSKIHCIKSPKRFLSRTRVVMILLLIVAIPILISLTNRVVRENAEAIRQSFRSIGAGT
jgi:hypothetical protein